MSVEKQKIEIELDQDIMKVIELISKAFYLTPSEFIAIVVKQEIDYIKDQIKDEESVFLEKLFEVSRLRKDLMEALRISEEPEFVINIPEKLKKDFERLCGIAHYDVKEKILEILKNTVWSAEVDDDGRKVDNF